MVELFDAARRLTGAIAFFTRDWAEGTSWSTHAPYELVDAAEPVLLGRLRTDGRLYFSDAAAHYDDRNVAIDVDLPAGIYAVVAWLAEIPGLREQRMAPFVRPMALAAYSPPLLAELGRLKTIHTSSEAVASLSTVAGLTSMAMCHLEPMWAETAAMNAQADLDRGLTTRAASWILQADRHGGTERPEALSKIIAEMSPETTRHLLALRGQRAATAADG